MIQVQLFIPCFVDQLYPETGMNMVRILEHLGCVVHYNARQTCCGQPAYNAGYTDEAKNVARKFLHDFDQDFYIVAPSGSCTGYVRSSFDEMFADSAEQKQCKKVKGYLYEFTEFLTDVLKVESLDAALAARVTYHDACGALRECGIKEGPRRLLSMVRGLELVEMQEAQTCCGFGGTFAVKFEPISVGMAQTKAESALETGARYIVSTDVSCMMHLQAYIDKQQYPLQTIHIADLLAKALFAQA
ncbi:(Fe-S)-binding protein [Rurimicrobium arvi]|uniref:(Fe-S)-binding protein n=1 Tax=Rurimicrobium arvi TaxID=2049916 RepID=A0ABP8N306_9BACT